MKEITCCFTGHRPDAFDFGYDETDPRCLQLKHSLTLAIERAADGGYTRFITGMALGVDIWCAEIVLDMIDDGLPLTLEAAIPIRGQTAFWNAEQKSRYGRILGRCGNVARLEGSGKEAYLTRNRYMLSRSSLLIAVLRKQSGGAAYTVRFASRMGVKVWYV